MISIWDDGFARSQIVHAGRALRILRMAKLLSLIKLLRLSRLVRYVSQFEEIYVSAVDSSPGSLAETPFRAFEKV